MIRFLLSFFACQHKWGWPRGGRETCSLCGKERAARVDLTPTHSTASIPRWAPKAVAGVEKVTVIRKRRKA